MVSQQINDTVDVMRDNINKVSQRGENLDSLQDKTDNLAHSAQGFRRGANRVRKQMWWKDMKMRICVIVGVIILLVIIIVPSSKQSLPFGRFFYRALTCSPPPSQSWLRNIDAAVCETIAARPSHSMPIARGLGGTRV